MFQEEKDKRRHENTEQAAALVTEQQVLPITLASLFSPFKITAHKLTHRKHCAQTLWTHPVQDEGVTLLSLCIKADATELLKQSQDLLFSRPSFRKLGSADTEVFLF